MVSCTTAKGETPMPKMNRPAAMPLRLPRLAPSSPPSTESRTMSWPRKMMLVARIEARGVPSLAVRSPPTRGVQVLLSLAIRRDSQVSSKVEESCARGGENAREGCEEERKLGVARPLRAMDDALEWSEQVASVVRPDAEEAGDQQCKRPLPALTLGRQWCDDLLLKLIHELCVVLVVGPFLLRGA